MTHIDKRISHYCHRLGLTSWDIKDILVWFNTDRATNARMSKNGFKKPVRTYLNLDICLWLSVSTNI